MEAYTDYGRIMLQTVKPQHWLEGPGELYILNIFTPQRKQHHENFQISVLPFSF
jgi:hypothetical protein